MASPRRIVPMPMTIAIRLRGLGNLATGGRDWRIVAVPSNMDSKKNPRRMLVPVDDSRDDKRQSQRITPPARV